jgi:hypothetical protein
MNFRQAIKQAVADHEESQLPSSELIRSIDDIMNDETIFDCPHSTGDGCSVVDIAYNEPSEPF